MQHDFDIEFLDHVAIFVEDLELSIEWYQKVLGLQKYQLDKWGAYPIFMLSNRSGVALFPAKLDDEKLNPKSRNIKIDHFAFNVTQDNFRKAIMKYDDLGLEYEVKDHYYFDSVYTRDPDGHIVELTAIKVNEKKFYRR